MNRRDCNDDHSGISKLGRRRVNRSTVLVGLRSPNPLRSHHGRGRKNILDRYRRSIGRAVVGAVVDDCNRVIDRLARMDCRIGGITRLLDVQIGGQELATFERLGEQAAATNVDRASLATSKITKTLPEFPK
jgi:hypothetical protein